MVYALHTVYAGSEITNSENKLRKFLSAYFDSLYRRKHVLIVKI